MKSKRLTAVLTSAAMTLSAVTLPQLSQLESLFAVTAHAEAGDVPINGTTFPDDNFRQYVLDNIDTDDDEYLSAAEIAACKSIYIPDQNIADLTGIGFFSALEKLDCQSNTLSELDVSNNTALELLQCGGNHLTSLDVSNNTALTELSCSWNCISELDISGNTALEYLACSENKLSVLDVSQNTVLKMLYCYDNILSELDVSNNTALELLWCGENHLTSLDVSNNIALTDLSCDRNSLSELDVSGNTALDYLNCEINNISELDVSKNTALTALVCSINNISKLDCSHNLSLESLTCYLNSISELDIAQNTALNFLQCYWNQLSELDVSHNTSLVWLECNHNNLSVLDVSKNTELYSLECGENMLTSLDLSNNAALTEFSCDDSSYNIGEITGSYDLSKLPGKFDPDKASDWAGAEYDAATNSLINFTSNVVTYTYDCGSGKTAVFTLTTELHEHSFSEWKSDETGHWHECKCGEKTDISAHDDGEWTTVREATPIAEGLKQKQCTVCGFALESEEIERISEESSFDDENEKSPEEVENDPNADENDTVTEITINPAFNMKDKNDDNVNLDITNIKIKAKEIYDDAEKIERAEEALGIDLKPNAHYNLLDLTLWDGNKDISNGYKGLVKVIIPIPKGHLDKNFTVYRLAERNGVMEKEIIPSVREDGNVVIYLDHFSTYALLGETIEGATLSGTSAVSAKIELIDAAGNVIQTTTGSSYSFAGVEPGTYKLRVSKSRHCTREYTVTVGNSDIVQDVELWLYGDVNHDGSVTSKDATQALRYLSKLGSQFDNGDASTKEYRLLVADVNGDGKFTSKDATQILRYVSRLSSSFDKIP